VGGQRHDPAALPRNYRTVSVPTVCNYRTVPVPTVCNYRTVPVPTVCNYRTVPVPTVWEGTEIHNFLKSEDNVLFKIEEMTECEVM
jgi:hypothetical protein